MQWVIACILVAALEPYLFLSLSGWPSRTDPARWGAGYDNRSPRASLAQLRGWRQRAHFAQLNGHEAFAPFAVGMLCAQYVHVADTLVRGLGGAFLLLRLAYGICYVADRAFLRSAVWTLGLLDVIALYLLAWLRLG